MEKVAVVGSGIVGQVLADGFLSQGFEVMRGSRDPENSPTGRRRPERGHAPALFPKQLVLER